MRDSSSKSNAASTSKAPDDSARSPPKRSNSIANGLPRPSLGGTRNPLDPNEYQHAKRRLRKAVIEHYRCVEMLLLRKLAILRPNAGVLSSVNVLVANTTLTYDIYL